MCARFTLFTTGDRIARMLQLGQAPMLQPRYNVAPSQLVAVIGTKASGSGRGLARFRWGFLPNCAEQPTGPRPVNAKSETVAERPMFANSFRHRRCLIPAGPTEKLFTCAIMTTPANSLIEPVHDRMPAILPETDWDAWLDPAQTDSSKLLPLLQPFPVESMEVVPASPVVNNSRYDAPDCLPA
jgi:putative SOS response-associated peptidase YedK